MRGEINDLGELNPDISNKGYRANISYIEQNADPLGAAVSSLLVIIAVVLLAIADRIVGIGWLFGIRSGKGR